jgi:transposase
MARVEVITGPERRRRWTQEQKRAIIAESLAPGAVVSEVARRADVRASQVYRWRQELCAVADGFAQVLIAAPETASVAAVHARHARGRRLRSSLSVARGCGYPAAIPAGLASAVVKALARR